MIDVNGVLNDVRKLADISYEQGYLNGQKHDADMLEQIKDLIRESDKNHAYTLSYPAYVFITRLKKIVGWQLEDYEERQNVKKVYEEKFMPIGKANMEKRREERQKQTDDEIKVGDEVYDKYNPYPRVVTLINEQDMADLIDARGNAHSDSVFCLKKTGRHFPQIAEVLEQMRKERE